MRRWDITANKSMKKYVILFMLALMSFVWLKAETVVYAGGIISDGFDSEPVYWRNGVLYKMFPKGDAPNGSYRGMAVEKGIIYSAFKEGSYVNIYKAGNKIYSIYCSKYEDCSSIAVLNGNVFVVLRDAISNKYYVVKNGNKHDYYYESEGEFICVENGILYYSRHCCGNYICGYYAGGGQKTFAPTCQESIEAKNMRVIGGNVYFTGYSKLQGNEKGSIYRPKGFDGWIYDVAAADVFYYIGIPRKN